MSIFRRKQKKDTKPLCAAIVAAAGNSSRMGEEKILLRLGEEPVLAHTVRVFEQCPLISQVIVVTRRELMVSVAQICREYSFKKVVKVVQGGESRTESVFQGIQEISCDPKLVAIHDGARPFLSQRVLEDVINQAIVGGAAAPALLLKDTIKQAHGGFIDRTVDRSNLYAIQTPQVFDADLIRAALQKALEDKLDLTDDCAAVERMGMKVALTKGAEENFKLTTPGDFLLAQGLFAMRKWML